MDNFKNALVLIGTGIAIGAVLVLILIFVFGARPRGVSVGPVDFDIPTDTPTTQFVETPSPTTSSPPKPTIITPPTLSYAEKLCPIAIKQSDVDALTIGIADPETVKSYIANFGSARIGDAGAFPKDTTIPASVVVATNFDEQDASKWSQYPVIPIARSGSYGLFQTVGEYTAPNSGACRIIVP